MKQKEAEEYLEATKDRIKYCPIAKVREDLCQKDKCFAYIKPRIYYNIAVPVGEDELLDYSKRYPEWHIRESGCKLLSELKDS